MSAADYAGRTADVLAFHGSTPGREVLLEQTLVPEGTGGAAVTGVLKLSQHYVMALLERRGYHPLRGGRGTGFMADAQAGYWRTAADVRQSFYSANLDAKRLLQLSEPEGAPDDERLLSAEAGDVTLTPDRVFLTVVVTSVAGTSRRFILPLPVAVKG